MIARVYWFLVFLGTTGLIAGAGFLLFSLQPAALTADPTLESTSSAQTAATVGALTAAAPNTPAPIAAAVSAASGTSTVPDATNIPKISPILPTKKASPSPAPATPATTVSQSSDGAVQVERISNPYPDAPLTSAAVNSEARAALVNILCQSREGGSMAPISGSGMIIDSRGVILTNAHVAQYVMLSESPSIDLHCIVRTGAPATAQWIAEVLYIPSVWVQLHAQEINTAHPTGTGEHDYALLLITGPVQGQTMPSSFPSVPFDTREAIGFLNDQVLGASYPAEFLGGLAAENDLYPVSSVSTIDKLLTFASSTVDAFSIGGVVEAQSGSSGGGVLNAWGRLIGVISTTSDAPTTAGRDLRAITLSYISRDLTLQTGSDLSEYIAGDLPAKAMQFQTSEMPGLLQLYYKRLSQ